MLGYLRIYIPIPIYILHINNGPLNTSSTAACQPHLGFFATLRLLVLFWNSYSYSSGIRKYKLDWRQESHHINDNDASPLPHSGGRVSASILIFKYENIV